MKGQHHDSDSLLGGVIGFMFAVFKGFLEHIDGWAILQSMLCALAGYLIVRLTRHFFPESKSK